ncbi:nesprin-2 isoform X14 [Chanodichthys erythropterus]|uniref:nesprin-2 isoform X14 n=1 Tax=Chanodichthys erythropterus TaxID=933992 RepID=UPI00351DC300
MHSIRVDSLGAALELMDSITLKISEISERLEKFIKEPKDIKGYTLANPAILKDVKDLDESIQTEMDRLSRFDSEPSHLDLRDRSPLTQVVLNHRSSLDRLRQQVRKSDAAARALDRFLMSLRTVELDVSSVQSAPSNDPVVLQDSRSKLALIRKGVSSLKDKAPQLDQLLGGAQLEVTQEGSPVSCLDMVGVLVHRVEEADDRLMIRQNELQKEQQNQGHGLRRKTMQAELRKVQLAAEKQGLKDPTMPAVQHRIRALSDLESRLNSLRPEYQSIKKALSEVSPQKEHPDPAEEELDFLWEETERAVSDRQEQCTVLMDLLKKFQNCRSYLSNTLQRAEQTINEQASYMGKDNLQRLLAKVVGIKEDLNGLGPKMEEFRSVCRQLQSQLKKIPDCSETPFETEADALVDSWLDVSEKTDSYMDNLRVGLELWEKQLVLGGEVDSWTSTKLIIFSESHPFSSETEVLSMKNEIQHQEDNLEHFHKKLLEIQELLQSKESPLELQVMETNLRKKMEQVKELFSDCTDVFQELLTVKAHLTEKIDTYQSSVKNIRSSIDMISSEDRTQLDAHLQDLCEQLLDQEEQAESLLKEINLMSSITGPQALEELTNHIKRLKDSIVETRELIRQKKEQGEKSFLQTIKEEFQSFEEWLQDEQLSVNECFENPERKQDVEMSMQRLTSFLASKEGEQRLAQLKERFERGGQAKIPSDAQALLSTWHQEQEGELATLRAHCQGRHKQLDDILQNLNSLQEEHNHLKDWLQHREQVPEQREKLRQIQEEFLKESGRMEAFNDLLSTVRMRGLRGDPFLRDSETLIDRYHSLGILLENQAQVHKILDEQTETFQTNAEQIRAWIRDLKQGLECIGTDTPSQKKHINAQAVLNLSAEGDSKLVALKEEGDALCAHEILEDTRRQELIHTFRNIEDEWKRVLDIAQQLKHQAELQDTLSRELKDLQAQEESTQSWVREQLQMLHCLGKELEPQEKLIKVQAVLDLADEADSRLASLQRQGKIVCSYKELDNERRSHTDQTQRLIEEEWKKVLQLAQELKNKVNHEESLYRLLQTFCDHGEDTRSWIRQLRETLDSLHVTSSIQERLNGVEAVLAHRSEGDCKLADLKAKGGSLFSYEDLEEDKFQTIQQTLQDVQQEWTGVLMDAQELKNQAEFEDALSKDLQDLQEQEENTQSWIKEQHQKIELLGEDTQLQERMNGAQAILNSESEGDYKLATLRRKAEGLCSREGLEEKRKQEIQLKIKSIEDELKKVLARAQELKNQAELQDSLARELQNVYTQEEITGSWVKSQKDGLDSLGKSTHGTQDQIEERLSKAQGILSLHSEGNSKIAALKRSVDHLYTREDLAEDTRHSLIEKMKNVEEEWKSTLQQAQDLHSLLKSVVERLVSCQCQKEQLQSRLEQVKQQTAALPRHFPWPGLGDRRHTVEQAKSLLDRTRALTPSLSVVRALGREMSQLTRDSSWIDPSWATMEECIPELIKEITEFCVNLEEEIRRERVCAQLVEQHTVAQDWLREQVKSFGALPTDRHELQGSINTLKALLQTVDREKREMKELDAVKDSLMDLCTPGGCDTLTLEVSHLHDLCVSSEKEMRERLAVCEARLSDIDLRLAGRAQILREQAESLLVELRAQDHSLGFLVGSQNISQLQENWHSFKTCERDLDALEGKVCDLGQALRLVPPDEEPPSDVISIVDTVTQQYCSLRSKLSERQNDCADSTVQCVRQALQNIQSWNQMTHANPPCSSASSMQTAIEEGAKLRISLQVALSHKELLRDCLGPDLAGKLERDGLKTLNEADTHINDLKQDLKNLEEKVKHEAQRLSPESQRIQLDSQVTAVTPSTKESEQLEFVSSSSLISESCKMMDNSEQAKVQPSEIPESKIHLCVISETTTKTEVHAVRKSPPVLETDTEQADVKTTVPLITEMLPEPEIRVYDSAVPTSSHGAKEAENENLIPVALETKADNDVIAEDKKSTSLSEIVSISSFIIESCKMIDNSEQANVQPSEIPESKIPISVVLETTTETEVHAAGKSPPILETDKADIKTTVHITTEIIPEPGIRVYDSAVPTSTHGAAENEAENVNLISVALETKTDNDEISDEKKSTSSSAALHSLETTVQDTDSLYFGIPSLSTKGQESQLSVEVVSSDSFADRVECVNTEAMTAESDKAEEGSFIPHFQEEPGEQGESQTKRIATLILDVDTVHIESVDTDSTVRTASPSAIANEKTLCQTMGKQDDGILASTEAEISDIAKEAISIQSFLNEAGMVSISEISSAIEPEQRNDIDTNRQVQTTAAPLAGTQGSGDAASRSIGTLSWNNGPNSAIADREGNWTTNNGPREIQRRYIILDFPEGEEMQRRHAHEATPLREPVETQIQGSECSASERMETEDEAKSAETETEVLANTNRPLDASEQSELVEANQKLPLRQVGEVMDVIVEEETKKTLSGDKAQFIEVDPTPPIQTDKVNVSTLQEKPEGEEAMDVILREETKTPSGGEEQSTEIKPNLTPPIKQRNDWDTEVQSERMNVSLTSEEKPEVGEAADVIVEEETNKIPSGDKPQFMESEPKLMPPVRGRNIQSNKVNISTQKEKSEGEEAMEVIAEEEAKTNSSSDKAQSIEAEPKLTSSNKQRNDQETEVQSKKVDVSPEEKTQGGDAMHIINKEETKKAGKKAHSIEAKPKPTSPVRRRNEKKIDIQSNKVNILTASEEKPEGVEAIDVIVEEEIKMAPTDDKVQSLEAEPKPTPPVRRKNESETYVQSNKVKVSTTAEKKSDGGDTMHITEDEVTKKVTSVDEAQSIDFEPKPTAPVRKRNEGETELKFDMMDVTPTPPTRRHKGDSLSSNLESQIEGEVLPTPPSRRRKERMGSERFSLDFESQPTPPARRRKEKEDKGLSLDLETQPTPPARRRKEEEDQRLSLHLETQPTPPARRRKEEEDQRLSLHLETQPTPPARRCKEEEDQRLSLHLETQPTPPARRRKEKGEGQRLSVDLETQPTPPLRRCKDKPESETLFYSAELGKSDDGQTSEHKDSKEPTVKPTPPVRRKISRVESDVTMAKPTPPTRRKDSKVEKEIEAGAFKLKEEMSIIKPTPPLRRKDSQAETEIVSTTPVLPTPPTRRKKDQIEADSIPLMPEEPQVIPTPTTSHKESSGNEKVCAKLEVEADVEPITKQEDKEVCDTKPLIGREQQEEGQDSDILVPETISVVSQTESITEIQPQNQDVDVSPQVGPTTEISESPAEEEEEPKGPTMKDIFMEIKNMTEKIPKSELMEGVPHESTEKLLDTSSTDLEAQLKRLVFHLLDLRTCPAALNTADMAKQLEEAEECRRCAQRQVSMMSRQDQANGDIGTLTNGTVHEGMQQLSAQWSAVLWDAASSVHSKEVQLQMVTDFDSQTQKVKATLERLKTEREALRTSPAVSSFAEEERLRSFLRNMEQERTALGELIQTCAKLSPHLSLPERQAVEIQQNNLQSQWRALENDAEIALYMVNAYAKESGSLLQEVGALKDHLENIQKTLDASKSSPVSWDGKRAQEIMNINADLSSTHQQYLYLQQTSEALAQEFQFKAETSSIEQDLQCIKDQLDQMGEQLAAATPSSSNPTLCKIVKVMTDALAWAKQTEFDIEGRQKKVSLLPEEVHRQIKDLKKLQSEMSSKQSQLKSLVEEVNELIHDLDEADVSMVTSSLKALEDLSKSTAGKLARAVHEMESGLQTREKMSEQIADVDSWVVGHLQREALRREDYQSLSPADLDRRLRQIQDTLGEAEKQSAVTEALLMKSRDIASELSVSESTQLNGKLTNLQEDIKGIVIYEKACCQKVMDVIQSQESSQRKVSSLENSLRQMLVDLKRHRFPVTKDILSVIEPFKQMIVERKSQVEQVSPCAEDKRRELLCVITELHHKMIDLDLKAQAHERYLSLSQSIEKLKEEMEAQIPRTKDESINKEERYRACQNILIQIPLIKLLCEETRDELQEIIADLYPSQISAEQTRLNQILESLNTSELTVNNNLQILEWDLLKHIDYPSEKRVLKQFLKDTNEELEKSCNIEPKEAVIEKQLRKHLVLRKTVESRMRVLAFLEKKIGAQPPQDSKQFTCLKDMVLERCDQQMVSLTKAKELLRNYTKAVNNTIRFLQRAALVLLPSMCSARSCSEKLKDTQQTLLTLDTEFQSHISQLQTQTPQHPCFNPQQTEFLHIEVLGGLLVRLSTLKAQAQIQLESLKRCVECQKHSRKCYEELCQQVRDSETLLSQCASKKITSHKDCKDQQLKLKALVEEVAMLLGKLVNLREWCSLYGCRANREDAVNDVWVQVARLQRCANDLQTRSEQMEAEWSSVTRSVEQAASVLEQMDAELPDSSRKNLTGDELQELLLFCSQYQDRLDCEHRALSALELRVARLLGVPPHLEQAPPIELCQKLQALQERYHSLKERSTQGQRAVRTEVEERGRVQEQLEGVREWLESAISLLSVLEHEPSKKQLQEVHSQLCTQKAVLQRISESLKMMYSDKNIPIPEEIEGLLQEVSQSLQEVEEQVKTAVEKSGPLHRLGAKISEIKAGLGSVQSWLEQKSLNFNEAESTQKRVWDELDNLHTRLTAVEVELQDMSEMHPDETRLILDNLANTQQTHTRLNKQAEQRTTFLSKVRDWLQEHQEMVKGSQSWISEAQSWLTTPCTYTTARCLDSHVSALQMVLDDSAQMRRTLQGFSSVLTEMGSVFDVSPLEEQLSNADRRVADMQHSLLGPLSQLEHAAAEVDAIESEVKVMEKDVAKIKSTLTTKEDISQDSLKATEDRIDLMKRTVAEIQNCKDGLCLPDKAENTLLVFKRAELLQKQLLELEQLALEYSIEVQDISAPPLSVPPLGVPPTITEEETQESGQIQIAHVEEDVLRKSGATLMTVEQSTPEQRFTWICERSSNTPTETQQESEEEEELFEDVGDWEEEASDEKKEEYEVHIENEDEETRRMSPTSLYSEAFSCVTMEDSVSGDDVSSTKPILEQAEATDSKVETDTSVASGTGVSEALSEADATVESQSLPADMEQGAWRGEQTPHTSDTLTLMTLSENTHKSLAPPTETEDMLTSPNVMTSGEGVGGALGKLVGVLETYSTPSQQTHLDETPYVLQSLGSTNTPEHRTHTPSDVVDHSLDSRSTHDTHTPITVKPHLEKTEPLAASTSLATGEARDSGGWLSSDGLLHACREKAEQLEACLERAQVSLEGSRQQAQDVAMQDSIEQQLHTCQTILVEIEQKISSLPACELKEQEQHEAELLNIKLQLLKNRLVTVQVQLQDRQSEDQVRVESQRPLQARLTRSNSVQEMLSSSRTKLFRQSSLQQQRELEHGLNEQRDLTKAIAIQCSRARTHNQSTDEYTGPSAKVNEDKRQEVELAVHRKWTHLCSKLTNTAESEQDGDKDQDPSEILAPSVCLWSGAAVSLCLQEIQSNISQFKELQNSALTQGHQSLDEGLFEVLSGVNLTLGSLTHTLVFQPATSHTDRLNQLQQLQNLSAELNSLGAILTSHGSEVIKLLGSGSEVSSTCFDLLTQRVCDIQKTLAEKQEQLQERIKHSTQLQKRVKDLHDSVLTNTSILLPTTNGETHHDLHTQLQAITGQKQEVEQSERELAEVRDKTESQDQPSPITQQISTLEAVLDSVWSDLEQRCGAVQWSLDQQQMFEKILKGLQMLLNLGREKLACASQLEFRNPAQLQTHLSTHTVFFRSLAAHLRTLQQLSVRIPDSASSGWETEVSEVERQVSSVVQQAQAVGTVLHSALQVCTHWDENHSWLETLLQRLEAQLPITPLWDQTEMQLSENTSVYQSVLAVLEQNRARISLVLDEGRRQQELMSSSEVGVHILGVSTARLEQRLAALKRRVEQGLDSTHHLKKLWNRYHSDFEAFNEWKDPARERLHTWKDHMNAADQEVDTLSQFHHFIEFNKELEVKSALKASVISSGSLILLLSEREHIIKTQKISRSSSAPRTSTPSGNTTIPEDPEPSETSNLNPEDSSSVDVIFPSETNVSSIQNISSEETLSTTERSDANITNEGVISEDPVSSALDLSVKQEMALSPVLLALQSQLSQVEQDWVEIQTHIPTVQQRLHQSVMESLSPEGLLADVRGWITGAESRLQAAEREGHNTCTAAELTHLLRTYQGMKREMACQQMSADFINQCELKQVGFDSHTSRYKHTAFAESLGHVSLRWLTLQAHLNIQIRHLEEQVRISAERDNKLHLLQRWVKRQKQWMRLAERPTSRSFAERSLKECEELEEKLKAKFTELTELGKRTLTTDEEDRDKDFLSKAQNLSQSLTELSQQSKVLGNAMRELCTVWSQFESGRSQAIVNTIKICQSLEYYHAPLLSLSTLQNNIDKLQVLKAETEECDRQWEDLNKTTSILIVGISTDSAQILSEHLDKEKARWSEVKEKVIHTLKRSHSLLKVWQRYSDVRCTCSEQLRRHREQLAMLNKTPADNKQLAHRITELKTMLQKGSETLQTDMNEMLEASKDLIEQVDDEDAVFIRSECRLLTRGYLQLEQTVKGRIEHMQEDLEQFQEFERLYQSLETQLQQWESKQRMDSEHTDISQSGLMEISSLSPDLDLLNTLSYRLTLSDSVTQKLQHLNRKWAQASAHAQEKCSELQAASLHQQSFEQRCESWLAFLQRMEDSLAVEIASTYPGLREQQRMHQCFQAELSLGHQILHSVISESLLLLQKGDIEDRSDFLLKLAQLREHWQGAVQRAAQRRALVEGLIQHWHLYTHTMQKLRKLLTLTHTLLSPTGPTHCSVLQLRLLLDDLKRTELLFHRSISAYLCVMEVGRQLFSVSDTQTQMQLQTDLAALQEDWEQCQCMLGKRKTLTSDIIKKWETCETRLADQAQRLEELRARLKQSIPDQQEEMEEERLLVKEVQDCLEDWAVSLSELSTMKTDLSQYILTDDVLLLQEQVDHLHCQWEELCLKVSLRKQEIADRLNAWIIFNEKNRELCEWLTQMENKVAHSAELSIEEMVEKLKKDCMEEINLFSENKTHLKQLGEQLITASNKTKETEINDKIKDINDRWQHLFDHIEARVRKLKETLITVQQLDKNMSNLRTWLSRVEGELAKPITYTICHSDEIQRKLAEHQDLQKDIEQHTEGVASVLTLCDVLLHDADACGSDGENDSIQQTTLSLDRRWRNICAMSMERRMRIEETWRLWCKFLDDYARFEEWLNTAERTVANPATKDVLYTCAKEELKKFEAFQRQVHERLTQLELVNKQYRRLARENRTDGASKLKLMVHEGNQRWDMLQKRVAAVLRRLKHFTSQREDFEGTREGILVWLTEMDLQLTNVEHFSESDIHEKMRQLNAFQQEITLNTNKIDALIVFGENLIQKSAPLDAVLIEDELEELHSYCQEVFGRVARFHYRLISRRPVLEEDREFSDRDTDPEDSADFSGVWEREEDEVAMGSNVSLTVRQAVSHLLPPALERSGRETPVSVDSIPLEWDHTVDVGGSSSPEDDEELTYYSALSDVEVTESSQSFVKATSKALKAVSGGRSVVETWHSPDAPDRKRVNREIIRSLTSSPTDTSTQYHPQAYDKLMSECAGSIDCIKRVKLILNEEEQLEDHGLTVLSAADKTGVIERWEILQVQSCSVPQDLQQWHRLNSDLTNVMAWLNAVMPELEKLQTLEPKITIRDMESNIHKLKDMQRTFNGYKAVMIGVNLSGRGFQHGDSTELRELRENLQLANQKWAQACAALDSWEHRLHQALMECQEFHETLHSLLLWLAKAESQRYMVNIHDTNTDLNILQEHQDTLKAVQQDLQSRESEVNSLQEISSQILLQDQGEDTLEAKEKVHVISNKLRLLIRQIAHDLLTLQSRLDSSGPNVGRTASTQHQEAAGVQAVTRGSPTSGRTDKADSSPARPFLYRVLRAAFPLHILFLLLLVVACLVPLSEDDYSCTLSNNFARSFYPMLLYTNGPPPT